ncbi:hypothetical protein ACQJBY_014341 [Aegilops geniculata]
MAPSTETKDFNVATSALPPQLHFILVPLVAQGHTIPMVDLARLLAGRGARVSVVTTPWNAARLQGVADSARRAKLPLDIVELPFAPADDGLPPGCGDDIDTLVPMFQALHRLAGPFEAYVRALGRRPGCIIYDKANAWTAGVARSVGVPLLFFHGPSCFYSLCELTVATHGLVEERETCVMPGMPVRVEMTRATCSSAFLNTPAWEAFQKKAMEAMRMADGAVANTFLDLEGQFVSCYEAALGMPVWALGPFCLSSRDEAALACRGDKDRPTAVDQSAVTGWLDAMCTGSVVYASFGSLVRVLHEQLYEVGHGLEDSGRPFLWVVKESEVAASPEVLEWLRALEARTAGRGLVVRGWAPQLAILSHRAVGAFVTHCGWNSLLESVAHGVPVVTWPHLADQFLNERLAVDVLGVGVPVGAAVPDGEAVMVARGDIARAVSELMGGGDVAEERRRKAKEYGERARTAMALEGSSYQNLTRLIQRFTPSDGNGKEQ